MNTGDLGNIMQVEVPEDFGRRMSFGTIQVKDLMIFVVVFVAFVAVALILPNVWLQLFVIFFGLILGIVFAFKKVDNLDFYNYLYLKIKAKDKKPQISMLKIYGDDIIFNGSEYFRIIEVMNGVAFEFMSDAGKIAILRIYEQLLNACDFPLQIVVKTRKINPEVFYTLIKEDSELAEGYKKLIYELTKDLYVQIYYVVVPVRVWELGGITDEQAQVRRAREMLDIRTKIVQDYLQMLGVGGKVVKGYSKIYDVIKRCAW